MIKARCIQKFRDSKGRIIGYKIQDTQEKTIDVKPEALKNAIVSNQIEVTNLTLTKDGRLIDRKQCETNKQQKRFPTDQELENIVLKSKMIGLKVEDLGFNCYAIFKSEEDVMIIISSNLKRIVDNNDKYFSNKYKSIIKNCKTIKIIGGSGLTSTNRMFFYCNAQTLDLSSFDTSNVINMSQMFCGCEAQTIDLSSFDTSKVENMCDIFNNCKAQTLDISSFNTSNVRSMGGMFCKCKAQTLDFSSLNTSKVIRMNSMFEYCNAQTLDLSSFDTSNVEDMEFMFKHCRAQTLELSSLNTSKVKNMSCMFYECETQKIDLSNFDTSNVKDMSYMFVHCNAQITATDPKILKKASER